MSNSSSSSSRRKSTSIGSVKNSIDSGHWSSEIAKCTKGGDACPTFHTNKKDSSTIIITDLMNDDDYDSAIAHLSKMKKSMSMSSPSRA